MQQSYNLFESLGNASKVWLYLAERKMSDEEVRFTLENLSGFNTTWSAHGKKLNSNATVLFNHIIVLAVDETLEVASGCSIDSSVHAIKKIGSVLNIDFF
ncbi:MAG: ABC transporter ATPase, partial [Crocinitomicaceae bacterium]